MLASLLHLGNKVSCTTEYEKLNRVIVCPPLHMEISEVINETQKHYVKGNINKKIAIKQHEKFRDTLKENGVEVLELPANSQFPEQVFTRDIGFTIGKKVYISKMSSAIREGEEAVLKNWLDKRGMSIQTFSENSIEGGDVLVDNRTIFVGVSDRTTDEATRKLNRVLTGYNVVTLPFNKKYLHLDCVFNILSPKEALIYKPAFQTGELEQLSSMYDLVEVKRTEQFSLGTNILSLGNRKIISLPENKSINKKLRLRGYEVIEVDFSEIIKSGGSFRCCTMPVLRGHPY